MLLSRYRYWLVPKDRTLLNTPTSIDETDQCDQQTFDSWSSIPTPAGGAFRTHNTSGPLLRTAVPNEFIISDPMQQDRLKQSHMFVRKHGQTVAIQIHRDIEVYISGAPR
jgi:hypothetical protein